MLVQLNVIVDQVINAPQRPLHRVKRAVPNAAVNIFEADGETLATIYADDAGATELVGPFKTDTWGRVVHEDSDELYSLPQDLVIEATKRGNLYRIIHPAITAADMGGRILAEAIKTDAPTFTSVYPTLTALVGLSLPWTATGQPITVEAFLPSVGHNSDQARVFVFLLDGAAELTYGYLDSPGANASGRGGSLKIESAILTPAAGTEKTYSAAGAVATGTGRAGGGDPPKALLRIRAA